VAVLAGNSDGAVRARDLGLGRSRCLPNTARGLLRTRGCQQRQGRDYPRYESAQQMHDDLLALDTPRIRQCRMRVILAISSNQQNKRKYRYCIREERENSSCSFAGLCSASAGAYLRTSFFSEIGETENVDVNSQLQLKTVWTFRLFGR
jgi:hypothetical protein